MGDRGWSKLTMNWLGPALMLAGFVVGLVVSLAARAL